MVYVDPTIPLPAEPSHTLPRPLFSVRPKWPASLNSRPVLALGTFCLHRLIYAFRTLTFAPHLKTMLHIVLTTPKGEIAHE